MIDRLQLSKIKKLVQQFPAVAILGARQTGKTTIAQQLIQALGKRALYLDLEKASHRARLQDPESYFLAHRKECMIIDEVQQMPELFTALRPEIDEHRKPGRFILLGSASPSLIKGVSETLAGRIAYFELPSIHLLDALKGGLTLEKHWYRGGFPEALTAKTDAKYLQWADHFFHSYVERDLNMIFGATFTPALVNNFWTMLAGNDANLWNAETYARSLGVTGPTANRYLDFLEGAYLIGKLHPWSINVKKRVVKSPKIYLRDTGILHYLTRVQSYNDLAGNIIVGASWENYVVEQIRQVLPLQLTPYFYRTHHGAECDLILVKGTKPVASIEIKLSNTPDVSRGFYECIDDLGTAHNYIITPASDKYLIKKQVTGCNLIHFLQKELPKISKL
ncbi:MAG: ATP-binding protein [Bacteroidota bacterium]